MSKSALTIVVLLLVLVAVVSGYYFFGGRNSAPRVAQIVIGEKTFQVEVASTAFERAHGLSGR